MYKEIVNSVESGIIGRLANKIDHRRTDNTEILLSYVHKAGEGNHLEIGTLFGGSAISVALLKQQLDQSGLVFCIDPLDGYYTKHWPRDDMIDPSSGIPVTSEILFRNIKDFDVENRIFVMKSYSTVCVPFTGITFSTAYIDGDHKGETPYKDWLLVKDHVTDYVIFDNCAGTHLEVLDACHKANDDPNWECAYDQDITYVVQRVK